MKPHIIRQGDVLLVSVEKLPAGAVEVGQNAEDGVVLAYGEVTHHRHIIAQTIDAPKVRVWSAGAERFLQVMETTALTHEEHAPITLLPGVYKLPQQVEYSPRELQRVAD